MFIFFFHQIGASKVSVLNVHVFDGCENVVSKILQSVHTEIVLGDFTLLSDAGNVLTDSLVLIINNTYLYCLL